MPIRDGFASRVNPMKTTMFATGTALLLLAVTAAVGPATAEPSGQDRVTERGYDGAGRLLFEKGFRTDVDGLVFERVYYHADQAQGNAGSGPTPSSDAVTDCPSTKYVKAGWFWSAPYSAVAASNAALFDQAGNLWDAETGADIFGSVTSGKQGNAGTYDGVNQIEFVNLGASTTIAVTTTWSYRSTGQAVESDGQYNTYYTWSTTGAPGTMDVLNIAAHEIGHTFGLNHPKGAGGISCLTMYAYANTGETQKRTLGDGDILGIEAIYGA
jgi:hypothetical protein